MNKNFNRRDFLVTTGKTGLASLVAVPLLSFTNDRTQVTGFDKDDIGWTQQPLKYGYGDIEPSLDAQTMEIHYTKHAAAYAKNLADATRDENVSTSTMTIVQLLAGISKYTMKMRNNAGGHYNHELFWKSLRSPVAANKPSEKLQNKIAGDFNSFEAFQNQFTDAAKNRFGSGWAWLVYTNDKRLVISSTANQDNPLMNIAEVKGVPLLGLDVWEHAYYLKYQNRRPDYINAWWNAINWDFIEDRYKNAS